MGRVPEDAAPMVVHAVHPTRGHPVTFHIHPVPGGALRRRVDYLVEQADGRIEDDEVWMTAIKTVELLTADEARWFVEDAADEPIRRAC